jgi:hypothetical protein
MNSFRVHVNRRHWGRYLGFKDSVVTEHVPSAVRSLDALPGDILAVEDANDDWERCFFRVEHGPDGLRIVSA